MNIPVAEKDHLLFTHLQPPTIFGCWECHSEDYDLDSGGQNQQLPHKVMEHPELGLHQTNTHDRFSKTIKVGHICSEITSTSAGTSTVV